LELLGVALCASLKAANGRARGFADERLHKALVLMTAQHQTYDEWVEQQCSIQVEIPCPVCEGSKTIDWTCPTCCADYCQQCPICDGDGSFVPSMMSFNPVEKSAAFSFDRYMDSCRQKDLFNSKSGEAA
jgi:hypothetical protein